MIDSELKKLFNTLCVMAQADQLRGTHVSMRSRSKT